MSSANSLGVRLFDVALQAADVVEGEFTNARVTNLYIGSGKDRLGDWMITTSDVVNSSSSGLSNNLLIRQCTTAKTGTTAAVYTTRATFTS